MGCDIHFHSEILINGKWHHYSTRHVTRSYRLFALMAGVRGDLPPVVRPRGLPDDMTEATKLDYEEWKDDAHHMSYLDSKLIDDLAAQIKIYNLGDESDFFGHLFGNSYSGFVKYPAEYPSSLEDVRFVFWFDN